MRTYNLTNTHQVKHIVILLITLTGILLTSICRAQQKPLDLSFKVYGGYGIFQPGADLVETSGNNVVTATGNTYDYHNFKFNFGQAPHFGAGVSLKLTDIISVGIDADYLTGSNKMTAPFKSNYIDNVDAKYHVLSLIPNATFTLGQISNVDVYNTLGLVTGISTKLNIALTGASGDTQEYHYGVDFGFKDALGVKFKVAHGVNVFGELSGFFYAPEPTKRVFPGLDNGSASTQYFKHSGQVSYTNTSSGESYTEQYETPSHFSSIGLNVGVSIDLKK